MSSFKLDFPSTQRNREAIVEVLKKAFDPAVPRRVLEVASGSGQHAWYFVQQFPAWIYQPTDLSCDHVQSITAYRRGEDPCRLLEPLRLDVMDQDLGLEGLWDLVIAINLLHISPWETTLALLKHSATLLVPGGYLFLYGAFWRLGYPKEPSNLAFDQSLKARDSRWGVRFLDDVVAHAAACGLEVIMVEDMPSHNLSVIFQSSSTETAF